MVRGMKKFKENKNPEKAAQAMFKELRPMVGYARTVPRDTLDDGFFNVTNKVYIRFKSVDQYREITAWRADFKPELIEERLCWEIFIA